MAKTESIQSAREALPNLEARIVDAIQKVGPKNISLLSRVTGAHAETIRYKVKRQFPTLGLQLRAGPDYRKLGLSEYCGIMKFSPKGERSAQSILVALSREAYLLSFGRVVPQGQYAVHFAAPEPSVPALRAVLQYLVESGALEEFEISEVASGRLSPMNPRYFNFQSDSWEVDWSKIRSEPSRPLPVVDEPPVSVDKLDLLLVKETEDDPLQHIVSIARKLKVHQKTLEYHYRAHVLKQRLVPGFAVRWTPGPEGSEAGPVMLARLMFSGLGGRYEEVQRAVGKLPFVLSEYAFRDGRYLANLCTPVNDAVMVYSYLDSELGDLSDRVEIGYVKRSEQRSFSLPAHMFDQTWKLDAEAAKLKLSKLIKR